jgi:hypothetical protein
MTARTRSVGEPIRGDNDRRRGHDEVLGQLCFARVIIVEAMVGVVDDVIARRRVHVQLNVGADSQIACGVWRASVASVPASVSGTRSAPSLV